MTFDRLKTLLGTAKEKPEVYIRVDAADKAKIERIKTALGQAETAEALDVLHSLNIVAIENEVIALSGRYQSVLADQRKGLLSNEDYRLQFNRIHHDLLTLAATLEKSLEPEKIIREIKINLRKRYQKRLRDKLADRQPINIQCAYSIEGTALERARIAYDEVVLEQKEVRNNLEQLFDCHRGRLLIIGEPGSGKTSLLLQLADALLGRRENRVPVILNLSTWKRNHKSLNQWLLETLPTAAAVSKAMAKSLVLEDRLLPLFDGLDEVAPEHRNACLEAIARYGQVADHQYVICSRIAEYTEMIGAPVYGQIKLLPLTQEQIVQQLEKSEQPEARFLLDALHRQPVLAKVVENPFYFNTTQLLLSSMKSMDDLHIQAVGEEEMKAELVEKFVAQQLDTSVHTDFPAEKSRRWLGFLAKKMEENGLVVFELTDLRLGWLGRSKWMYFLGGFLMSSVASISTENKDLSEFILENISLYIFWLTIAAFKFNPAETISWNSKLALNFRKKDFIEITIGFFVFFAAILFIKQYTFMEKVWISIAIFGLVFIVGWNLVGVLGLFLLLIIYVLIPMLNLPNFMVMVVILVSVLLIRVPSKGLTYKAIKKPSSGYKRMLNTLKFEILGTVLILTLIDTLFFWALLLVPLMKNIVLSIEDHVSFLIFSVSFYLITRHFIIRLILSLQNHLPLRLATFLREMTHRHLFESDGGSWRLRHKILQDYFVRQPSAAPGA